MTLSVAHSAMAPYSVPRLNQDRRPQMKNFLNVLSFVSMFLIQTQGAQNQPGPSQPASPPREYSDRLRWWAEGRFGIFIHWGPVSLKGTEISWSRANTNPKCPNKGPIPADVYDNLYKEFNPVKFDASEWVRISKTAGAKYMVLTAKHCDGFLLWHSKVSDYNISASPFKRDICAELSAAARKQGIRIGWYFSPMDWRDPDFRTERNQVFLSKMQSELRELLTNYGKIDLLWFDWDGGEPLYNQAETYSIVKSLQPEIIINNRLDLGPGNTDRQILSPNADYYTPEQHIGSYDDQRPWESCMTLSRKSQWAYGGPDDGVKPFETCLKMLIGCAGGDGNLLLNVGPTPTGEFPPEQVERLLQLGDWLARFGESIYGTRGGPFKPGYYGVSTRKGHKVYLFVTDASLDSVQLPPLPARVLDARVLKGDPVEVKQSHDGLEIILKERDKQPIATVIELSLDRSALELGAINVPATPPVSAKARTTASNVYQNLQEFGPEKATDGRDDTRWATDAGLKSAWLEVDLGKPTTIKRAKISEAFPNRVQRFALKYRMGDAWETILTGTTIGESWARSFSPVTAQYVRLEIIESTDGPTIWEFQLFQ
jgi:alpha-L-fucosidase